MRRKIKHVWLATAGVFSMVIILMMLICFVLFTMLFTLLGWLNTILLCMAQSLNEMLIETLGSLFKSVKSCTAKPKKH